MTSSPSGLVPEARVGRAYHSLPETLANFKLMTTPKAHCGYGLAEESRSPQWLEPGSLSHPHLERATLPDFAAADRYRALSFFKSGGVQQEF